MSKKKLSGYDWLSAQHHLRLKIKNAHRNMMRQRRKEIDAQGTRKGIRVPSSYWEQVKRDYIRELNNLYK